MYKLTFAEMRYVHDLQNMIEGACEVLDYSNTVDFIAKYCFMGDVFHDIKIFCLCDVVHSPNTKQNLLKLQYYRPQNTR